MWRWKEILISFFLLLHTEGIDEPLQCICDSIANVLSAHFEWLHSNGTVTSKIKMKAKEHFL